ncbi:MAG: hypothetical protein MI923_17815 [Phycisphaerales bacterium]|nr:hypothetical protein [Phycisphaerales bacterium]
MKNQNVKETFKASSFFVRVEIKEQSSLCSFLTFSKLNVSSASCSLGAAQASIEQAIEHAKVRKQFNRPLADNQVRTLTGTTQGISM